MTFFPKIYEIPRTSAARELCVDFAVAKNTVYIASTSRPQRFILLKKVVKIDYSTVDQVCARALSSSKISIIT